MPIRWHNRLAVRLALLLSVALLPLGIISVVTTLQTRQIDARSAERALLSLTADTKAGRRALVESALTTARALAQPTLERLDDRAACNDLLSDTVMRSGVFSFIGFTELDGGMRCVSSGEQHDFSESTVFRELVANPQPVVRRSEAGASSGQPVVIASYPVREDGVLRGFLSVVIGLRTMAWLRHDEPEDPSLRTVLFNRLGEVVSHDEPDDLDDLLPSGASLHDLARSSGAVFDGRTGAGERAVFAVADLVPGQLFVLGVWDPDARPAAALTGGRWPVLFPLAMWIASLGVVYFAVDYLVIRHLRHMRLQMRRFALGDRTPTRPLVSGAAHELLDLDATFQRMTLLVARDEAELSTALDEKDAMLRERTVLLKEVHHRVKNNLQLIASILNLQMRRLHDPRTRKVLQNVQDRVIGLATIHRNLYQSEALSGLRADELFEDLLRHLFAVGTDAGSGIDLRTDLAPVTLEADQLVPLSLLLTEAVTNALKYTGRPSDGGRPWVRVRLQSAAGEIGLCIANSLGPQVASRPDDDGTSSTGLGSELIAAFAAQLGATIEQGEHDTATTPRWELCVRFAARASDAAEPEPPTLVPSQPAEPHGLP